jgi:hypothetical protein
MGLDIGAALTGPTAANQGDWAGGQAAQAISSCYASIERTGK